MVIYDFFSLYFMFISMLDECKLHSCFIYFLMLVYHKRGYNLTIDVHSVSLYCFYYHTGACKIKINRKKSMSFGLCIPNNFLNVNSWYH